MVDYFLADDLSGALDAAAGFHHAGHRVTIALTPAAWPAHPGGMVGLTTETRNLPSARAAAIVSEAIAGAREHGARLVYKKIDSTLRGPVAAELAAVRAAYPGAPILFAPANPGVGRTVRDGRLLVHGVPVVETEYARDPVSPVTESDLRRLLGAAADGPVEIPDVATTADLAAAVRRMPGDDWIAVGSGALAGVVSPRYRSAAPPRVASPPRTGPILFVGGSAHPGNREQAALLAREHGIPVQVVEVGEPSRAVARAVASLRERGVATLMIEAERRQSALALSAITEAARAAVATAGVRRLFVTGGETAYALCQALGIFALEYRAEIEPGLSLSETSTKAPDAARWFAIKPGGFGDARTWLRAYAALRDGEC